MSKSLNKTNTAIVSEGLRQIFTTPIIVCLVIFAIISIFSALVNFSLYEEVGTLFYDLKCELKTQKPFYIIYTYYEDVFIGIILGFLLGFFQFRFLSDKNACYTRLSFGIKRKALFFNTAFYPLICAIFIVFISKLLAVIVNIYVLGLHVNIIKMFFLSVLVTIIPIIFSFTVTIISNILTTRKLETILLTASVISLPYALFSVVCNLFSITLYGYGDDPYSTNEISNLLSKINPITMLFDYGGFDYFSYGVTEKTSFGKEILWCIVCIGVCFGALLLTANFFEKRFKPENCGKKGVSKLSLTVISFSASVLLSAVIIENTNPDYTYKALEPEPRILLALASGSVVAIIINLLVMLGKNKIKHGLLGAGISVGVHVIIIVIGLTGCFGFTTKIPDIEDISSIYVYVPFDDMYENTYNTYFEDGYAFTYLDVTEADDFEIIKNIHKSAIKTKGVSETSVACDIEYTLKNGDIIRRHYVDISEETAMESIKLWDTKAVKDYYKVKLNQDSVEKENLVDTEVFYDRDDFYFESPPISPFDYLIIVSKDNRMTELSPSGNVAENFVPTREITREIMDALYKDICTLSAEEWFMPEEQYGALVFDSGNRTSATNSVLLFDDVFSGLNTVFYINSNMTNTVNVLKKYDYMRFFDCFKNVEKAHIVTADNLARFIQAMTIDTTELPEDIYNAPVKHGIYYTINNYYREDYLVFGCGYLPGYYDSDDVMLDYYLDPNYKSDIITTSGGIEEPPQKEITPSEAKNLIKKSFMAYSLGNSGEFLVVKYAGGSCMILALPK